MKSPQTTRQYLISSFMLGFTGALILMLVCWWPKRVQSMVEAHQPAITEDLKLQLPGLIGIQMFHGWDSKAHHHYLKVYLIGKGSRPEEQQAIDAFFDATYSASFSLWLYAVLANPSVKLNWKQAS